MLIKVFSGLSMLSKLPPGVRVLGATGLLNKGGGSNMLPGLVTKQQAVEFPQVLAIASSSINLGPKCILFFVVVFSQPWSLYIHQGKISSLQAHKFFTRIQIHQAL